MSRSSPGVLWKKTFYKNFVVDREILPAELIILGVPGSAVKTYLDFLKKKNVWFTKIKLFEQEDLLISSKKWISGLLEEKIDSREHHIFLWKTRFTGLLYTKLSGFLEKTTFQYQKDCWPYENTIKSLRKEDSLVF